MLHAVIAKVEQFLQHAPADALQRVLRRESYHAVAQQHTLFRGVENRRRALAKNEQHRVLPRKPALKFLLRHEMKIPVCALRAALGFDGEHQRGIGAARLHDIKERPQFVSDGLHALPARVLLTNKRNRAVFGLSSACVDLPLQQRRVLPPEVFERLPRVCPARVPHLFQPAQPYNIRRLNRAERALSRTFPSLGRRGGKASVHGFSQRLNPPLVHLFLALQFPQKPRGLRLGLTLERRDAFLCPRRLRRNLRAEAVERVRGQRIEFILLLPERLHIPKRQLPAEALEELSLPLRRLYLKGALARADFLQNFLLLCAHGTHSSPPANSHVCSSLATPVSSIVS